MQDGSDFSLPIVVVLPERRVVADDKAATTPFVRAALPGVDLRPARERATLAPASAAVAAPTTSPLPAARHAWLQSSRQAVPAPKHPVPSRLRARSLLGVPPPPPARATPLSDDDERRMQRRVRAWRRIAWAQRMLERFQFVEASEH